MDISSVKSLVFQENLGCFVKFMIWICVEIGRNFEFWKCEFGKLYFYSVWCFLVLKN